MKVVFSLLVPLVLLLRGNDARPDSPKNIRLRGAGIIPTTVTRQLGGDGRGLGLGYKKAKKGFSRQLSEKTGKLTKKDKALRQLKSEKSGKSEKKSKSGKSNELSKKEKSGKSGKSATGSADEARNNVDEVSVVVVWGDGNETRVEVDDDALEISLLEEVAEYADEDDDATEPTDPPTSVGTSAGTSEATSEETFEATSEATSDETEEESTECETVGTYY